MKLIFVHDHKFRKFNGSYYSTGGLNDNVLSRYTKIFDEVIVIARTVDIKKIDSKLSKINNKKVEILNIFNLNLIHLNNIVKQTEYIIIRLPSINGLILLILALMNNKPYLIEVVGCAWNSYWYHSLLGKIIAPIMWLLNKFAIYHSQYVLYVTETYLQNKYPTKGISENCSDVFIVIEKSNENIKKNNNRDFDFNNRNVVLGTIGNLDIKYKGQSTVIKAISMLSKNKFLYHMVGGGSNKYLLKIAKKFKVLDNIDFKGVIEHNKILDFLDTVDIYIQPSITEGLPRSLIEAMSRGCICIGSNVGGIPELLPNKFIFKNRSVNDLISIINHLQDEDLAFWSQEFKNKAFQFDASILDEKRSRFYRAFSEGIIK